MRKPIFESIMKAETKRKDQGVPLDSYSTWIGKHSQKSNFFRRKAAYKKLKHANTLESSGRHDLLNLYFEACLS